MNDITENDEVLQSAFNAKIEEEVIYQLKANEDVLDAWCEENLESKLRHYLDEFEKKLYKRIESALKFWESNLQSK